MKNLGGRLFKYRAVLALVGGAFLISTLFQNCAETDVNLSLLDPEGVAFSSDTDYDLQAPLQSRKVDRYVFLVDMSFSMVSGPCPQDVDANVIFARDESRQTVNAWDPNKRLADRSRTDYQQVAAYDCYVDPDAGPEQFPMPYRSAELSRFQIIQNPTIVGSDFQGHRLSVVKQWVEQLRTNLSPRRRDAAKIVIVPFTTGKAMQRLLNEVRFDFRFHDLDEPGIDHLISDLEAVHEETREKAMDEQNFHRWKDRAMGSSSPTEIMDRLYDIFVKDMEILSDLGVLRKTNYNFFILTDGMLTPTQEQIDLAVNTHYQCVQCSADDDDCPNTCQEIREALEEAVGDPAANDRTILAIKFAKIQGLPQFYGGGRIRNHFVQVNEDYSELIYKDFDSLFEILGEEYSKFQYKFNYWTLRDDELPFDLATNPVEYQNYSLTGVMILNPNLRVAEDGKIHYDSDADGLFDEDERANGLDPLNPRTNGACLDSLAVHPAFADKCQAILEVPDCDVKLDTDMDSLNECEERMLGTNPNDFDSDDDLIPDYFEWTYNYNPILSDKNKDTNGDGITNLNAFLAGLGPNHNEGNIKPTSLVRFRLTEQVTDRQEDEIWISQFSLELDSIPYGAGALVGQLPEADGCLLYHTRNVGGDGGCSNHGIRAENMFYQVNRARYSNQGLALLRLRDKDNSDNLIWKVMNFDITDKGESINTIDLNQFRDLDVLDEVTEK